MKYDKEAGMERDVLNARPFQRYMPSRYLLQLYNENIDQRYKVTFKDAWYANKNPLSESDLKVYPLMATGDTAIYIMKTAATDSQKYGRQSGIVCWMLMTCTLRKVKLS